MQVLLVKLYSQNPFLKQHNYFVNYLIGNDQIVYTQCRSQAPNKLIKKYVSSRYHPCLLPSHHNTAMLLYRKTAGRELGLPAVMFGNKDMYLNNAEKASPVSTLLSYPGIIKIGKHQIIHPCHHHFSASLRKFPTSHQAFGLTCTQQEQKLFLSDSAPPLWDYVK